MCKLIFSLICLFACAGLQARVSLNKASLAGKAHIGNFFENTPESRPLQKLYLLETHRGYILFLVESRVRGEYRARYYSDDLGRFISRDPKGYVDGMSMYSGYFAGGLGLDPSGLANAPSPASNVINTSKINATSKVTSTKASYKLPGDIGEIIAHMGVDADQDSGSMMFPGKKEYTGLQVIFTFKRGDKCPCKDVRWDQYYWEGGKWTIDLALPHPNQETIAGLLHLTDGPVVQMGPSGYFFVTTITKRVKTFKTELVCYDKDKKGKVLGSISWMYTQVYKNHNVTVTGGLVIVPGVIK